MTEPPINKNLADLNPEFRRRLTTMLAKLSAEGLSFRMVEGFRTKERQQWLYGQGRPDVKPYGRTGKIVTQKSGTAKNRSNHQGDGTAGSGRAADCYPLDERGKVTLTAPESAWRRYAEVAESVGLTAGYRWKMKDSPHVELRS